MKPYKSFLIRCWYVNPEKHPTQNEWRFSLQSIDGDMSRFGFTEPQDLLRFLTRQIEEFKADILVEEASILEEVSKYS